MKKTALMFALSLCMFCGMAQSITKATIGSIGGQFKNGNITLSYTLGETIVGTQNKSTVQLATGFWSVVPAGYSSSSTTIYSFIGNGNFTNAANWLNNQLPPNPLPSGAEIIIDPAGTGQCILNATYTVNPGGKFSVIAGKKLLIPQNFIIQ